MTQFLSRPRRWAGVAALAMSLGLAVAAQGAISVQKIAYKGWPNCYKISNGTVELIVTTDVGPRIIFYGFVGGQNQFQEFADEVGQTNGNQWLSYGGHRLWAAPENLRTYFPDNVPIKIEHVGNVVKLIAPVQSTTGLQFEIDVHLAATGSHVHLDQTITNHGKATQMAPWSITVMHVGGAAILPLPPKGPHGARTNLAATGSLALWSYTDFTDSRWVLGDKYIELKQIAHPTGNFQQQKIGVRDVDGWGAYYRDGFLFVKRAEFNKRANYPDFGCNFETYSDPTFLELETLGAMRRLAAGGVARHDEDWWLYKDVPAGQGDAWIDANVLPRVKESR